MEEGWLELKLYEDSLYFSIFILYWGYTQGLFLVTSYVVPDYDSE